MEISGSATVAPPAESQSPPQRLVTAEVVQSTEPPVTPRDNPVIRFGRGVEWLADGLVGSAAVVSGVAILATIPVLNLLSLGYLFEVTGRIARSGRLRDGLVGVRQAARLGTAALGIWLSILPLRVASNLSQVAHIIDAEGGPSRLVRLALILLSGLILANTLVAVYAGGKLRHFAWPLVLPFQVLTIPWRRSTPTEWFPPAKFFSDLFRGRLYSQASQRWWAFCGAFRPRHYFWQGLRGYLGTSIWLLIPVSAIVAGLSSERDGGQAGLAVLGAFLLAAVVMYVPLLQAHFAAEQRFGALFEWRRVRQLFRRAPVAHTLAILLTFALAVPLYLARIEATDRELSWLPAIFFVLTMVPARWVAGWAMGRARRREHPRHLLICWSCRFAVLGLALAYVLIVYVTSYIAWDGAASLYQQHAFLTPAPFIGGR